MQSYDTFSPNIHQLFIMRFINFIPLKCSLVKQNSRLNFLTYYGLVEYSDKQHQKFKLNREARMYLVYRRKSYFKFWLPTAISIIALLEGYDVYTIPHLKSFLQGTKILAKTILENWGIYP